jgi:phage gpG-like protein
VIAAHIVGDGEVLARLRAIPDAVNNGIARAITKLGIDLQSKVQHDALSGQVLAVRSGALKSSTDLRIDQSATAIAATIFSSSAYAGVHEFGFAGTVDVRASLRNIKEAFGRPISERTIQVRAYRRRMDLPERSFLRSAMEEMAPAIRDEVEAALRDVLTL